MNADKIFELIANIFAILTSIFAVWAWSSYKLDQRSKRLKLESYLKDEKEKATDKGQRSALHLMAKLGLTESEILQASFHSKKIIRRLASDSETNFAKALLLEYTDEN